MGEAHLVAALRYVALYPTRVRLGKRPEDWKWSSTRALIAGTVDHVAKVAPAIDRIGRFANFLGKDFDEVPTYAALRKAESVGRPVGSPEWLADMERRIAKPLPAAKRGRKPKVNQEIMHPSS